MLCLLKYIILLCNKHLSSFCVSGTLLAVVGYIEMTHIYPVTHRDSWEIYEQSPFAFSNGWMWVML